MLCYLARGFAGLSFLALALVAVPAAAPAAHLITIDSDLTIRERSYSPAFQTHPVASVILLAGGNGVLNLNTSGDIRDLQGNFLIRSARGFLNRKLNVAMLDAAPGFTAPGGLTNQRLTPEHATHLGSVIAAVRAHWPHEPVWLVGTSNGTLSVLNAAARLTGSSRPDGIVLTSSVTAPDTQGELGTVLSAVPGLANVTVPAFVMWHKDDECPFSHAGSAMSVFNGLTGLRPSQKGTFEVSGGRPGVAMPRCSAFGHHGYHEVEDEALNAIATFIRTHSP